MSKHCFSFLEDDYKEISSNCETAEEYLVEGKYTDSIIRAGKACELISKEIATSNNLEYLNEKMQDDRLNELIYSKMIIPDDIGRVFHKIRKICKNLLTTAKKGRIMTHNKSQKEAIP